MWLMSSDLCAEELRVRDGLKFVFSQDIILSCWLSSEHLSKKCDVCVKIWCIMDDVCYAVLCNVM